MKSSDVTRRAAGALISNCFSRRVRQCYILQALSSSRGTARAALSRLRRPYLHGEGLFRNERIHCNTSECSGIEQKSCVLLRLHRKRFAKRSARTAWNEGQPPCQLLLHEIQPDRLYTLEGLAEKSKSTASCLFLCCPVTTEGFAS